MRICFASLCLSILFFNSSAQKAHKQLQLGYKTAKVLIVNGLKFKDLNKNGQLDKYEDWRLPIDARAKDLLSKMSVEDKVGFMIISTTRMKNDWSFEAAKSNEPITSGFNEEDLVQNTNMFTRQPLPISMMMAAGTTKAVSQFKLRHFIYRANMDARTTAEWTNKLQEICEGDGLGIPAIIASNPRNHITKDASIGLSVGKTTFSTWPSELGLSAMHDLKLTRAFADIARQEWASVGLRKGYMYMADLSTEPRWQRIEGTFGENPEWVGKMMYEIIVGFQGPKLNPSSVALTTKHFPGGGAGDGGQDPHFPWGKREIFTSGKLDSNLIPFKYAIKAGTSSIMPYYSIPVGTKYPEVAYAYNKPILQKLLRKELGFTGIINSDTGPIEMMPWGAENLTIEQRYIKAVDAGVNIFSGSADPSKLLEIVKSGKIDIHLIDTSVYKLLVEFYQLGLFENPYVNVDAAEKLVNSEQFQAKANLALRKSIVLLRNENRMLPLNQKTTKVYLESYMQKKGQSASNIYKPTGTELVQFVKTPEEADVIVLWLTPGSKSLFNSDGSALSLSLSKNGVDVAYVNQLTKKKPTVLVVNYTNPWVIDEIYNQQTIPNIKSVIATFGTSTDALIDVLTGKFNPTGKMPFTTPMSEKVVLENKPDLPGYQETKGYSLFQFNEGISYPEAPALISKVYKAEGLKTTATSKGEIKNIFDGSGAILAQHSINAVGLLPGKSINYANEKTLERFIIVKSGPLAISLNGTSTELDRGSVVSVLPGDKLIIENRGVKAGSFYEMTYQSIAAPDAERASKGGVSFMINWKDIAYKQHPDGKGGVRQFFDKQTLMLNRFDIHVTTLNEGFKSHEPHTHKNEEIILMLDGNGEMQIGTEHEKANGGDVVFLNSMVLHNITNIGKKPCLYFAIQWN